MPRQSKGGAPHYSISNPTRQLPARGKKTARRAVRAFFVWGRARYRGHLISDYTQLAGFFEQQLVHEVRVSVSHLRCYWVSQEGTGTTTDTLIPQLVTYQQAVQADIRARAATGRPTLHPEEENEALDEQVCRVAASVAPVYSFPLPTPRPPGMRRRALNIGVVGYNMFSGRRPGRLDEIIRDMSIEGIHVGLFQGVRFPMDALRGQRLEWTM